MRIAYLASRLTLPGSPDRRFDAFEHDLMIDCLTPVFASNGSTLTAHAWDDETIDWSLFDAALQSCPPYGWMRQMRPMSKKPLMRLVAMI